MFCPECGKDNPLENRFCGMCGASLQSRPAADHDAGRERGITEPAGSRIAGPSFLGLSESPADAETGNYLLEDEPRRSRVGLLVLLLALLVVGAVFAYQRHYIALPNWVVSQLHLQKPAAAMTAPSSAGGESAATPTPAASDTNQEAPAPMTQSDRPADTPAQRQASTEPKSLPAAAPDTPKKAAAAAPQPNDSDTSAENSASDTPDLSVEAPPAPAKQSSAARLRAAQEAERQKQADDRTLILGENYLYGRGGVAKNCDQALIYLKAAAARNNAKAMGHLGAMYATGNCVPLDRPAAYRWFTQARQADPANPWLESNRQMAWRQMSATEQDRAARMQ